MGREVPEKFGQSLDTPTVPFLELFNELLFGWTLNVLAKFEVLSFTRS